MIRKSNIYIKNIYVSIILLIAIYSQTAWYSSGGVYYTVFLSCAVTAGFYVSFGREVIPGIVVTSIVGVLSMEMLVNNKSYYDAALITMPLTFLNVVTPFIFDGFLKVVKAGKPNSYRAGVLYIIAVILTTLIIAFLPAMQMKGVNNTTFLFEYEQFLRPMFVGLTVFGIGIILSNHYDEYFHLDIKNQWQSLLFVIAFALISYGIFQESYKGLDFMQSGSIFILLFIINAFLFSYRVLLFNSWMYVGVYNLVFFLLNDQSSNTSVSALNIYLLILVLITVFTKILIHHLRQKNEELEETKERYEDMVSSTIELFKVRETLSNENVELQETMMKNIFEMAMKVFYKIDYATCSIKGDKQVIAIATKGYDKKVINDMKLDVSKFRWNHFRPVHVKMGNRIFEDALGERYKLFEKELPKIKESVSILIKLNDNQKGAITFDIIEGNTATFTSGDLYNIGAFQGMINSFYEMNELTIKNNTLRDDIVLSLIRTLELFDHYTGGHSEDVAYLANLLSKKLHLTPAERYDIYWAGIVHDIGKIGIDPAIINKNGKLTIEEYKQVQQHPIFGYNILIKSEDLKQIAKLVRHHHEWYNGSGYPDGLVMADIPYGSQILQVADSVSSMATKRTYQDQKTFDKIIEELELYSGTQFNPKIANAMIELIEDGTVKDYFQSHKK